MKSVVAVIRDLIQLTSGSGLRKAINGPKKEELK
jgi:hypothetical protein